MNKLKYIFLLAALFIISCSANEKEIGLNEEIQHDDFFYSVPGYFTMDSIFDGSVVFKPKGNFYVVKFKVDNRAKKVDHLWNNSIAYIIDENGNTYENSVEHQKTLNRIEPFRFKEQHETKPYESEVTYFVFEVPESVKKPYLMVRGETLMGDFFDGSQFRKTKVKLF
ncbi:MAG TPA: hypothetical protein VHP32_04305 [Ignavibacteria bacterium]|nr:hypothetical protein [Ignavibacteria bacterium]